MLGIWLAGRLAVAKATLKETFQEERGDTNIIAVILLIIVVIAVVAIFKSNLSDIVNGLFDQIKKSLGIPT